MSDERQASRYAKELVRFVVDEACHLSEETDEQCGMLLGYIASLEADRSRLLAYRDSVAVVRIIRDITDCGLAKAGLSGWLRGVEVVDPASSPLAPTQEGA